MRIIINHSSMIPIYEQIVDQIKKQINNHTLKENDALPSVRSLAKELQISALTVKNAYDFLENEGLTKTIHGKGTFILAVNEISSLKNLFTFSFRLFIRNKTRFHYWNNRKKWFRKNYTF